MVKPENRVSKPFENIEYYFHVSKESRIKYHFEENLFSLNGDLIISNFALARILSQRINRKREEENIYDKYVTPGQINALGLLHEIYHYIINYYEANENPDVFERALSHLNRTIGNDNVDSLLLLFLEKFPPLPVFKNELGAADYLNKTTGNKPNREIVLEELLLLHLENINPPFASLKELFDDTQLDESTVYSRVLSETEKFFEGETPLSIEELPLIQALKKPILNNIDSIEGQLEYIKTKWAPLIKDLFLLKLLGGSDLIKEEMKLFVPHGGIGTPPVPDYELKLSKEELERLKLEHQLKNISIEDTSVSYYLEGEQFTEDTDWMPKVVMLAKNVFVWMDQLSRIFQREIKRLDQIPDEELDKLARWNFNSLWLIGLWQRSPASKKIKQFCGNPEAAASAYSLFDYNVADELGGDNAFENLKHRCRIRGIRLASDMVPNHTGIFSRWVLDNPDFYIQGDFPPYPSYSFSGPDLSDDPRYQIRIEDKYYSKQDAAVVFQLIENYSGRTRYVYHGNDGTNMPWNDTAQLNLLKPEVREALIQAIMHVARKTPIIRFDAAMTLAKKHYQRLWFPQPGTGGAIPSRSDYALTAKAFNDAIPNEFWREVVDRMNAEMPDTLLLAEAFWLMEGYFVRTLGMHRVYNSAFMHMFMKEENSKYRKLITNTLEFNPEILKRYVNFMSNPDEETAVNQFGKGDKYFGVAAMMITLPGLPMFAHGQIEGFTEKYGMEYQKAYYNEFIDDYLVRRHEEEIFPLLKLRYLFSQVVNFEFYDFITEDNGVNENVFAFTNISGNEKTIVIYNNSYEQTRGRIKYSTGKVSMFDENGNPVEIKNKSLTDALYLNTSEESYLIITDHKTKLEYLHSSKEIENNGFAVSLYGYQYNIFLNFREVKDTNGNYKKLNKYLNGKPVPSVEQALKELVLMPLHNSIIELLNKENLKEIKSFCFSAIKEPDTDFNVDSILSNFFKTKVSTVASELRNLRSVNLNENEIIKKMESDFFKLRLLMEYVVRKEKKYPAIKENLVLSLPGKEDAHRDLFIIYIIIRQLLIAMRSEMKINSPSWYYEDLMLQNPVWYSLLKLDSNYEQIKQEVELIRIIASNESIFPAEEKSTTKKSGKVKSVGEILSSTYLKVPLKELLSREEVMKFLGYNEFEGVKYYSKEAFELLLKWNFTIELFKEVNNNISLDKQKKTGTHLRKLNSNEFLEIVLRMIWFIDKIKTISGKAGYKYDILINSIDKKSRVRKEKDSSL